MNDSSEHVVEVTEQYRALFRVLYDAQKRAQWDKGRSRHGVGRAFQDQPITDLCRLYGSGFATGQAAKKMSEAQSMPWEQARKELLDAIVYVAGAVVYGDQQVGQPGPSYPGIVDSEVED